MSQVGRGGRRARNGEESRFRLERENTGRRGGGDSTLNVCPCELIEGRGGGVQIGGISKKTSVAGFRGGLLSMREGGRASKSKLGKENVSLGIMEKTDQAIGKK